VARCGLAGAGALSNHLLYYTTLCQNDLVNDEIQHLNLSNNAMQTRTGANIAGAIGEAFHVIPDSYVGALSTFVQIPTGTKLAGLFNTIAKIEAKIGPLGRRGHRPEVELRFPYAAGEVESVYLLCQYKSAEDACAGSEDREERFRHALLSR
jgi:hypothetical protein